jgi:hypothetical protein
MGFLYIVYLEKREIVYVRGHPAVNANEQQTRECTLIIIRLSTALARPKSTT